MVYITLQCMNRKLCARDFKMYDLKVKSIISTKLNSMALVRERTIPTEWPPPVGAVSANFCG